MNRWCTIPVACLVLALAGCDERGGAGMTVEGGDAGAGKALAEQYGCGTCHTIPGVPGAAANVGPPLQHLAHQSYIAGVLPNQPENLVRWIMDPPAVDPRTAMPDLGVSERHARDIAAFLYTLEGAER